LTHREQSKPLAKRIEQAIAAVQRKVGVRPHFFGISRASGRENEGICPIKAISWHLKHNVAASEWALLPKNRIVFGHRNQELPSAQLCRQTLNESWVPFRCFLRFAHAQTPDPSKIQRFGLLYHGMTQGTHPKLWQVLRRQDAKTSRPTDSS